MKPFSLSTLLKYRKQLEDTAVIKLNEAQLEMEHKNSILIKTEEEYNSLLHAYKMFQEKGIGVADLLHYENRLIWLKEKIGGLLQEIDLAKEKIERRRQIVVNRSRDKKVLEQLKTRQDGNWISYLNKKETAHLDEISIIAHQRKERNQ